ncbi:MAG: metallophosphoesterase [Bacteroidota bacterium]|nr:metallophosphoesterase [Bacteroidota bacterium]
MKKICILAFAVFFACHIYAQNIILLHTNDIHSKLNGYSPEIEYTPLTTGDDNTKGGCARIATLIQEKKSQHPEDIVLAVDAGDFLMGSLFHPLEKTTGFQLRLMKDMGYDYVSIGNHEFDYGPETLARIINQAKQKGPIPQLLLTNIEFDNNDNRDDELKVLFDQGIIQRYAIHKEKGVKIAFLGIYGEDAVEVQPYLKPVSMSNPYRSAKKLAKELKKSGKADVVIVLSHSGIKKSGDEWEGEDIKLAKKGSKYIDAVISGHSHTITNEAILTENTPVVQTGDGGQNLGCILFMSENNNYNFSNFRLIPINDEIPGKKSIQTQINKQQKLVQEKLLDTFNIAYEQPIFESNFELSCNENGDLHLSTLGPFLADAIYYDIQQHGIHTDVSMIAAGVIRDRINPGKHGKQGIADIFRICSLGKGKDNIPGYPLAQVYVTAKELKNVMEVLLMIRESSKSSYCYYSGIKVYTDMDNWFLNKISKIEIGNDKIGWKSLDCSRKNEKLYAISASAYMLEFIGIIKKKTFGLVRVSPKLKTGEKMENIRDAVLDFNPEKTGIQEGKEWLAFYRYVRSFSDTNNNGIPDMPYTYKTRFNPIINFTKD